MRFYTYYTLKLTKIGVPLRVLIWKHAIKRYFAQDYMFFFPTLLPTFRYKKDENSFIIKQDTRHWIITNTAKKCLKTEKIGVPLENRLCIKYFWRYTPRGYIMLKNI